MVVLLFWLMVIICCSRRDIWRLWSSSFFLADSFNSLMQIGILFKIYYYSCIFLTYLYSKALSFFFITSYRLYFSCSLYRLSPSLNSLSFFVNYSCRVFWANFPIFIYKLLSAVDTYTLEWGSWVSMFKMCVAIFVKGSNRSIKWSLKDVYNLWYSCTTLYKSSYWGCSSIDYILLFIYLL